MRGFSHHLRGFSHRNVSLALVAVGLSGGPRYTDIQILRAGRTKNQNRETKSRARREHTQKKNQYTTKSNQEQNNQHRQKNKPYPQPKQKTKTIHTKKKPRASCTLLRGWRLKTAENRRFMGSVNSPPGFRPDIGELGELTTDNRRYIGGRGAWKPVPT